MGSRLTDGFREIIELRWDEFVSLERNPTATNFDSIISSLVRACSKGNMRAIQIGLDRLDGKIATEIEVEYPQFYTLYPNATLVADDPSIITIEGPMVEFEPDHSHGVIVLDTEPDEELPTGSLRAVLERMLDAPKQTVTNILGWAERVDGGDTSLGNPLVKSVIIAGLMKLVHDGKVNAVFEILDQVDGKIADKYKILGDEIYIYNYATIAPSGAVKNDKGIYQIAAENTTNAWVARLEEKNNAKRR